MILKQYQSKNFNFESYKLYLLYGENDGLKGEFIKKNFNGNGSANVKYDEKEAITNLENIISELLNISFFEKEKTIIIERCTDKILPFIEEIQTKKISDRVVILKAGPLEKRSKLRAFFEKNEDTVCVPFYLDDNKSLSIIVNNFFREKKISISQEIINLIVERSRGERLNLNLELEKIGNYIQNKNKVSIEEIVKITNLAENFAVSELIDSCLKKNIKKTINILNENNYSSEDCILIIRTFLLKSKRILNLIEKQQNHKSIEELINSHKPPIFWKDKETVKEQITKWPLEEIKKLIYQINDIEILIKKNLSNSLNLLSDFLIAKSSH